MNSISKTALAALAVILTALPVTAQDSTGVRIWTLEECVDYAVRNNITIRQSVLNTESAAQDILATKGEMFPSLSFSTSQSVINRPFQDNSTTVSGTEILMSNSSTSYTGSYGLNAQWTLFNGGRIRKTLKQMKSATDSRNSTARRRQTAYWKRSPAHMYRYFMR